MKTFIYIFYRGFDFGNVFCEWMFNNNYENYPYFEYNYELYPNREQQLNFLSAYIESFRKETRVQTQTNPSNTDIDTNNNDDDCRNDLEHLLKEANYFALLSHLFWAFWSTCQASACKIKFEYLDYALARCDAYFKQKKILFPNGFSAAKF